MEEGTPEDRLSSLPDDVLVNIADRLGIADAAQTRVLSTRWEQIPSMLSKIVIAVSSFEPGHERSKLTTGDVTRANATVLAAIGNRTGSMYDIRLLRIEFYLGAESIHIGQTVGTIIATQKVGSAEFTILTNKEMKKATDDDLVAYGRQLSSLVNSCPDAFGGLARLKLENVSLAELGFPKIFSICKRLEFLRLYNCDMGELSLLEVEHAQLGELEIVDCDFERVDLKCLPMLRLLNSSGWISRHDPLSFGYVPLLRSLSIGNRATSSNKTLKCYDHANGVTPNRLRSANSIIWVQGIHQSSREEKRSRKKKGESSIATTVFIIDDHSSLDSTLHRRLTWYAGQSQVSAALDLLGFKVDFLLLVDPD